jgi:hypothetical protein
MCRIAQQRSCSRLRSLDPAGTCVRGQRRDNRFFARCLLWVTLRPNRTLHRCPYIGPVLRRQLTFCASRSSRTTRSGRPPFFRVTVGCACGRPGIAPHRSAWQRSPRLPAVRSRTPRSRRHRALQGVRERRRRQDTGSAKYHLTVHGAPHFFGGERHTMRPSTLEIGTGVSPLRPVITSTPSAC